MNVVEDPGALTPPGGGTAVTIGAYDGVHLGHRAVLGELRRLGEERGLETVVLTFDRHPATVVRPDSAPRLLTDTPQKLELLDATGDVDHTVVLRFDERQARQEAADFVTEVLAGALGARVVVVGSDFHFGRGRRGTVELLRRAGGELGFEVVAVDLLLEADRADVVSSTAIRHLVAAGDVEAAALLLGRPYEVRGVVERGDRRGQELGFPTANVTVPADILLPGLGIYAGWYLRPDGLARPAAVSLGRRPTFHADSAPAVLEAYLLDFDGDLYGEGARVRFVSRLRDEQRFDSVDELVAQTTRDVEAARSLLREGRAGVAFPG